MVQVLVKQRVRGSLKDKWEDAFLELRYESEFPPMAGMGLRGSVDGVNVVAKAVQYVIPTKTYICYTEEALAGHREPPFPVLLQQYLDAGFVRVK